VGTRYARYSSFLFGPRAIFNYVRGTVTGAVERHTGHNPGSSVAIYTMLALTAGLAVTGLLHSSGGEVVEELHEVLAYAFLSVVALHVAGVVWHTVRLRENISASMVHGYKYCDDARGIASSRPIVGGVFLLLVGAGSWLLAAGHDAASGRVTIPVTGWVFQLGEGAEGSAARDRGEKDDDEDDDD